jgi:hypothetical protein
MGNCIMNWCWLREMGMIILVRAINEDLGMDGN